MTRVAVRLRIAVRAFFSSIKTQLGPSWMLAIALILGAGTTASASLLPCPSSTTLDVLVSNFATLANGCFSQDVVYGNFSYSPSGNATPAPGVSASLILQNGAVNIRGWNFSDSWSQSATALASFTLRYSIEVCPSGQPCTPNVTPGTLLTAADASYAPVSTFPPGNATVEWSNGATVTITSVTPGPLPSNGNIGLGLGTAGPVTVTETFSGTGAITQTSLRFYTNHAPVPEPTTLVLLGSGLVGIGGFSRKGKASDRPHG